MTKVVLLAILTFVLAFYAATAVDSAFLRDWKALELGVG